MIPWPYQRYNGRSFVFGSYVFPSVSHKAYPKVWPWWKLFRLNFVKCSHDPECLFWNTPLSYNLWIYTRWGSIGPNLCIRKAVYIAHDLWAPTMERMHKEYERKKIERMYDEILEQLQ